MKPLDVLQSAMRADWCSCLVSLGFVSPTSNKKMKACSLCGLFRSWRNWIPGALILFPMSVRSGGSTSTSQVLIQSQRYLKSLECKLHCLHYLHLHHEVQLLDGLLAVKADCNPGCNRASAASTGSAWGLPRTNGAANLSLIFDAEVRGNMLSIGWGGKLCTSVVQGSVVRIVCSCTAGYSRYCNFTAGAEALRTLTKCFCWYLLL